jgi:hypothetical protein
MKCRRQENRIVKNINVKLIKEVRPAPHELCGDERAAPEWGMVRGSARLTRGDV